MAAQLVSTLETIHLQLQAFFARLAINTMSSIPLSQHARYIHMTRNSIDTQPSWAIYGKGPGDNGL